MSFQAVAWAIEQRAGSPSAKATLWSIANYANEEWCSWPSQSRISEDTEQSIDTVQRRLAELAERNLVRRIPLKFAGRRAVDFFILPPSPLFNADSETIEEYLPHGCGVDQKRLADDEDNTANCGNAESPTLPQTIPQSAATVTAMVRQQEPVKEPIEPEERETRAREERIPVKKFKAAWPTAATDSHAAIDREWDLLTPEDQRAAIDGIKPFLAELARHGRKRIPSGGNFLHERKWEGLPAAAPAKPKFVTFAPWSREWWAWFLAKIDRGERVQVALEMAKQPGARSRCERVDAMPTPDVIAGLQNYPGNGDVMAKWRPWFETRGLNFPHWREQVWVFLPGPHPPSDGQSALRLLDDAFKEATGPPQAAE